MEEQCRYARKQVLSSHPAPRRLSVVLAVIMCMYQAAAQAGYRCTPSGNLCCPEGQTCQETDFTCPPRSLRPSGLYGCRGELMQLSRLPMDWSYAGYQMGEQNLPDYPVGANVRDYGAVGDGNTDDTDAITRAINACPDRQAVYLPAGRYRVTQRMFIRNKPIAIKGDGPADTTIFIPMSLTEAYGNTRSADGSSQYSHQDAFIQFFGWDPVRRDRTYVTDITSAAVAGSNKLFLSSTDGIRQGMWVRLAMSDPGDGSLFQQEIFAQADPPERALLGYKNLVRFVTRVAAINSWESSISLERRLPVDVKLAWAPELHRFQPMTVGAGIHDLSIEFPFSRYPGHLQEQGYNALHFNGVVHGFISNVRIINSDSGIYCWGCVFCTMQDINITTSTGGTRGDPSRVNSRNWWLGFGYSGHRAFWMEYGGENLLQRFRVMPAMFHDVTVSETTFGNVVRNGFGEDLCFDHHKTGPWGNLFTNLRTGKASRPFFSGGGANRGPYHGGAYNTWWNVHGEDAMVLPPLSFAPSLNFVGFWRKTDENGSGSTQVGRNRVRWWTELTLRPNQLSPADLYIQQLRLRRDSTAWNVQVQSASKRLLSWGGRVLGKLSGSKGPA